MNINSSIAHVVNFFVKVDKIKVVTHLDTDGITAGVIAAKAFQRADKRFSIQVVKQLEPDVLKQLAAEAKSWQAILFLDLGSGHLSEINKFQTKTVVLDHHEVGEDEQNKWDRILFINSYLHGEEISAAGLAYLLAKALGQIAGKDNSDLAQLAVLGMVGDMADQSISQINNSVLQDAVKAGLKIKKGLLVFSSTRPLHKALELSSSFFIPGVSGSASGALELLRETEVSLKEDGRWRTLAELDKDELTALVTAIVLRRLHGNVAVSEVSNAIVGNIYTLRFFGHLEDARELSTLLNACGRLGYADIALALCLGNKTARNRAESIYNNYKHHLLAGLNLANSIAEVSKSYVLINAGDKIKDTLIGTITSIIAASFLYPQGTIVVGLAKRPDGAIKISARASGRPSRTNLKQLLLSICQKVGGECGGHAGAAGCLISSNKEKLFLELLKKELGLQELQIKIN